MIKKRFVVFMVLILSFLSNACFCDETTINEIVSKYGKSIVLINTFDKNNKLVGLGSGFIVSPNGIIITNYHVVKEKYSAVVKLIDGDVYNVEGIVDYDVGRDIAILKIKAIDLPIVKVGNSNKVKVGDRIIAIGNPEGLENSVSDGLISSIRTINGYKLLQISAPISHGSSGGALFNLKGEVIGITCAGLKEGQNLNFAIPINYAVPLIGNKIKYAFRYASSSQNKQIDPNRPQGKYDALIQKFISAPKEGWDSLIEENKSELTEDFAFAAFDMSLAAADTDAAKALLCAELVDYVNYYYYDKKSYDGVATYYLGNKFLKKKDYGNVSPCIDSMFAKSGSCANAFVLRGRVALDQNNTDAALADLTQAVGLAPNSEKAHTFLAEVYLVKNDVANSEKEFKEVLRINPDNAAAKDALDLLSGKVSVGDSKNKEAMEHFNKAENYFTAKKYKEAIQEYILSLNADPKFSKAYTYMGDAYLYSGNRDKAIACYKKSIELNPKNHQAYRFLGGTLEDIYNENGKIKYLDEAISYYEKALKVHPGYKMAQEDLARAKEKKAKAGK